MIDLLLLWVLQQDEDFNERFSTLRKDEKFNKLLANSSWMQVNIKPPTGGKCVPFFVDHMYTIDMLKSKIAHKMPYPADQQSGSRGTAP